MFSISTAKISDIDTVVNIHLTAFKGFFLSELGEDFLSELYRSIQNDQSGILFVATKNDIIYGFVGGTDTPVGFYKRIIKKKWWRFGIAATVPTFKNPKIITRLIRAFSRGNQPDIRDDCANLMSIAVLPEYQGHGIGKLLVSRFLEEVCKRGKNRVNLTTDKKNNLSANQFYIKMGFSLASSFRTFEGREMNEYIIDLENK